MRWEAAADGGGGGGGCVVITEDAPPPGAASGHMSFGGFRPALESLQVQAKHVVVAQPICTRTVHTCHSCSLHGHGYCQLGVCRSAAPPSSVHLPASFVHRQLCASRARIVTGRIPAQWVKMFIWLDGFPLLAG